MQVLLAAGSSACCGAQGSIRLALWSATWELSGSKKMNESSVSHPQPGLRPWGPS